MKNLNVDENRTRMMKMCVGQEKTPWVKRETNLLKIKPSFLHVCAIQFFVKTSGPQLCWVNAGGLRELASRYKSGIHRLGCQLTWAFKSKTVGSWCGGGVLFYLHQDAPRCLRTAPSCCTPSPESPSSWSRSDFCSAAICWEHCPQSLSVLSLTLVCRLLAVLLRRGWVCFCEKGIELILFWKGNVFKFSLCFQCFPPYLPFSVMHTFHV